MLNYFTKSSKLFTTEFPILEYNRHSHSKDFSLKILCDKCSLVLLKSHIMIIGLFLWPNDIWWMLSKQLLHFFALLLFFNCIFPTDKKNRSEESRLELIILFLNRLLIIRQSYIKIYVHMQVDENSKQWKVLIKYCYALFGLRGYLNNMNHSRGVDKV